VTTFALSYLALAGLTLAATSCSSSNERPESNTELKAQVAQALTAGNRQGDPCAEHGWYSDGECDTFCADSDADCAPGGDPVVCTLIAEVADGVCRRAEDDACRFQDPDCNVASTPVGSDPDAPVACALISEVANGVCGRPESDPCRFQDPDCSNGGSGNSGSGNSSSGNSGSGTGVACALYIEISDGVCSRPANDPCKAQDPDCVAGSVPGCGPGPTEPVVCALFIEQSDGVCSRPANDPCKAQDPDCQIDGSGSH